jgi:outer membrane protein OmpA-like peptidoglycan-associated protein
VVGTDSEGNAYVWLLKKREPFQEDMSDKNFTIVSPKPAFHDIQMGDQRVGTFRDSLLKNYFYLGGQFPSTIEEVTLVGAHEKDYRIVSGFTAGTMKPGEYYDLELSFQPQETGVRKARLRVVTPTDTLFSEITGTGLAQSYHIPSRYIDMGSVRVGKSKDSLASILENTGTLPVTLTGLRMEGPAFEYFSMDGNSNAVILKPGDKFRVPLRFHPEKAGRHNAVLSFSAGNSSYREKISLFGEGTVPEEIQLQGSVLSQSDSLPLEAEVEVFETGETTPVAHLQTLANGKFEFQLKRGHTYRIAAEKEKYIPEGVHIAIRKNETRSSLHRNIYLSPIRKGSKVRLDNVFFDFASADLLDQSYGELNRVVRFLKENPAVTIRVEGHTDHTGSDDYNMKLSKNRAEAVRNYLISQGVDSRRIQVKGYGESQPVAENSTAKGRAKNRRVEFVILSN